MHSINRCFGDRLWGKPNIARWNSGFGHERSVELSHVLHAKQRTRVDGHLPGAMYISRVSPKEKCFNSYGQYHVESVHNSSRWSVSSPKLGGTCNMVDGGQIRHRYTSCVLERDPQYSSRHTVEGSRQLQLHDGQADISVDFKHVRSVYDRSVCGLYKPPVAFIQQSVFRSGNSRSGLFGSDKLARTSQLLSPTIQHDKSYVGRDTVSKSFGYSCSPVVASTSVVQTFAKNVSVSPVDIEKQPSRLQENIKVRATGAVEKQKLGYVCLEDSWRKRLTLKDGWTEKSADCVSFGYAKSTISSYNVYINRYREFCVKAKVEFPCQLPSVIADFLIHVASKSLKPRGVLNMAVSALKAYFRSLDLSVTVFSNEIDLLVKGLVKSGTSVPAARTHAMPVECFVVLFKSWPSNSVLSIKDLRAKCVALLALSVMLRPSDIAPRSVVYDPETKKVTNVLFTTDQIKFLENGTMKLTLFGIKNDTSRTGFEVIVPSHSNVDLCPVECLKVYISRTQSFRDKRLKPVFLSLVRPYAAIQADAIAKVLRSVIFDAGLDVNEFSAKYFRPTGATVLIEAGHDPELVRKLGRWKCSTVFYDHYVHRQTPVEVIHSLLPE
jgi:hypothetical protein